MEKLVLKHFEERVEAYSLERELSSFPTFVDGRVLEVGCGARPSYSIHNMDFYGVDITPDMVKTFRADYPSATLILCDVKFSPFNPNSFHLIISNMLLHHLIGNNPSLCIDNIERTFFEIKRLLSVGGIFIIKEWLARNYIFTLIMYYVTLICAKLDIEISFLNIHSKVITYFLTKKKLVYLLEKNNFKIEHVIHYKEKLLGLNIGNKAEIRAHA